MGGDLRHRLAHPLVNGHSSRPLLAGLAGLLAFSFATAAEPLVTDRPDQTESAVVIPQGTVQIETGLSWSREEDQGPYEIQLLSIPSTLVRVGLSERLELRVGTDGWLRQQQNQLGFDDIEGLSDASLGVKLELADEQRGRPQIALLASTTLPIGDREFSSERADPSVIFSFSHDVSQTIGVGYNAGLETTTQADALGEKDTLTQALFTLASGFSLNDKTGVFVELFGTAPMNSGQGGTALAFDGGVTWLLHERLQLDASLGIGLNDAAENVFFGLGVSWRTPQ